MGSRIGHSFSISYNLLFSVLFIVYATDSLLFATSDIPFFSYARRFLPIVFAIALLFRYHFIDKTIIIVCASIFTSMILAGRTIYGFFYYSQIGVIIFGYAYSKYYDFEDFVSVYIVIMRIITIISIIAFLLSDLIRQITFIPVITNSANHSFRFLFFTNVPVSFSSSRRNWGPFWEPGVFQYYLNIAILFMVFRKPKYWYYDLILFVFADLTTLSGAAILPLPFILAAYYFDTRKQRKKKQMYIVVFSIALFVIVLMSTGYFDEIIYKVIRVGDESSSMGFRLGSMIANIKSAITHPLFGASPEYQDATRIEIISRLNNIVAKGGNTNTILGFFSYFGFPVGFYLTKKIYSIGKLLSVNKISRFLIFIALFLMTSNENLMQSLLLFVLMYLVPTKGKSNGMGCIEIKNNGRMSDA